MPAEPNKPNPRPPAFYRAMTTLIGPLEHWLGLGCRSYTRLASERLDRRLTLRDRLVCRLHWLICSICRAQNRRTEHLHELFKLAGGGQKLCDSAKMSDEAREKMRRQLAEELKSGSR